MASMEGRQEGTPFRDRLVENTVSIYHVGREKLYELERDPSKVVRVETFEDLLKRYGESRDLADLVELAATARRAFEEFGDVYGVEVPVSLVVGKDPKDRDAIYAVTDKIEGVNLDAAPPAEFKERAEALYEMLARYHADKWASGEPFLVDVDRLSQYVYGRPYGASESEPEKVYLVDTDIKVLEGTGFVYRVLPHFAQQLVQVERHYGVRFERAREIIERLLQEPVPEGFTEKGRAQIAALVAETRQVLA